LAGVEVATDARAFAALDATRAGTSKQQSQRHNEAMNYCIPCRCAERVLVKETAGPAWAYQQPPIGGPQCRSQSGKQIFTKEIWRIVLPGKVSCGWVISKAMVENAEWRVIVLSQHVLCKIIHAHTQANAMVADQALATKA